MPALLSMIVGLSLHKKLSMSVQLRSENRVGRVIFWEESMRCNCVEEVADVIIFIYF